MKHLIRTMFVAAVFSVNCFAADAAVASDAAANVIESPLYSALAPSVSVDEGGPWKQYAKVGQPDDVVIKQGTNTESYSAVIHVKRNGSIRDLADLRAVTGVNGIPFSNATQVKKEQENLLCVRAVSLTGNWRPFPDGSFFSYVMACADTKTDIYYELSVTWKMNNRKKIYNKPPAALSQAADEFFASFKTK